MIALLRAYLRNDPAAKSMLEVFLFYPGVRAIGMHRLAHFFHGKGVPLLPRAISEFGRWLTGIEIHPGARIGIEVVIDHGVGGTATGVGEMLKSRKPSVKVVAVEPSESAVLSGENPGPHKIQGIGAGFVPRILNRSIIDVVETVSSEEAVVTAKRVIREEGIPVGISSGAALAVALRIAARKENNGKTIVAVIPSYTERYLSTALAEKERQDAASIPVSAVNEEFLAKADDVNAVRGGKR